MELHPLCTLFPRLSDVEFSILVEDIQANGLRHPITTHDGMILDGGNRYRACIDAGVEPIFEVFAGGNLVDYVLSVNLHRRHLSPGQQAAIVASAQNWATAQTRGGNGSNQHAKEQKGNLAPLQTISDRAEMSGASVRTQKMADKVAKESPDLAKQVGRGEKTLPQAVEELTGKRPGAKLPKQEEVSDDLAGLREANTEQGQTIKELLAENEAMAITLEADDKLAAVMAENKKIKEMNRILEERVRGLQGEVNAAKRAAQSWQRKADKFEKLLIGKAD